MSTYFQTHAQRIPQWGRTRRHGAKNSGVVVIHTAESATDFTGADSGAESVARYFCNATRYASYHAICDADSSIQLVPWESEAWHDTGTNNHSVGISGAIQCKHWDELEERGERIVRRMAQKAAEYARWLKAERGITIPARKISRAQSRARVPGFLAHGTSDPGRRTDPGSEFDWGLFFREYKAALDGSVVPVGNITPISGNSKADNERIQKLLASHGYYKGVIDGVDGPMMKAAVRAFQKRHGLVVDGYFGPVSQAAWDKATAPAKPKPKPKQKGQPDDYADLRIDGDFGPVTVKALQIVMRAIKTYTRAVDGDWGKYTKIAVQEWLEGLGYYKRAVDGSFGKYSVIALQQFLASKHRYSGRIDGDFGPMTVKALQAYLNSQN